MNIDRTDRVFDDWLSEGPTQGPDQGLKRALAATRAVEQRHGWSFPSWWLPRTVADSSPQVRRYGVLALTILLLLLAVFAFAVGVGRQPPNIRSLLGPAADRLVAFSDGAAINVSRLDGSAWRTLSGSVEGAHSPVFSPNGKLVAFAAPALTGDGERLFVVPTDGSSEPFEVDTGSYDGASVVSSTVPQYSWAPDNARITFAAVVTSAAGPAMPGIYISAIYGGTSNITNGVTPADLPTWSPDGQWIAYRYTDGSRRGVELTKPDGSRRVSVASAIAPDSSISKPRWITGHEDDADLSQHLSYSLNAGFGSTTRAVIGMGTPTGGYLDQLYPWDAGIGGYPELGLPWSPDGNSIAILTELDGLVVVGINHSATSTSNDGAIQRLGHVADCWIDWLPDGSGLYGGSPNGCASTVVIPLNDPDGGVTVPGTTGIASWQPLEQ